MLDSVDYLCFTGGTAQMMLCVSTLGDASMGLRWTALVYERHGPKGAPCGLPWVTPQDHCEETLVNPFGDKPQMAAQKDMPRACALGGNCCECRDAAARWGNCVLEAVYRFVATFANAHQLLLNAGCV